MQKNPHFGALFKFDPEIERTFHKLKRRKAFQEVTTTSKMVGGEDVQRQTLRDYVTLGPIAKLEESQCLLWPSIISNSSWHFSP